MQKRATVGKKDPMPGNDATLEEIAEFWDNHSLADYWEETRPAEFEVNLKRTKLRRNICEQQQ